MAAAPRAPPAAQKANRVGLALLWTAATGDNMEVRLAAEHPAGHFAGFRARYGPLPEWANAWLTCERDA
ncbi:MAG: hypothetical protein K6V97_10600 [Actinomycetia bacterium]|nr:hypothetical protein [Actinomycetes bacterium]